MTSKEKSEQKNTKISSRKKTPRRKRSTKTLSSRSREIYRQCLSCGGVIEQKYSTGENSWCPLCFDYGSIGEKIGELPDPQLYGSWLFEQKEAEEKERKVAAEKSRKNALFRNPAPTLNIFGGAKMKTRKKHTGVYSCPKCCVEFDLFMDEDLKCDECGGPLVSGSLDKYFVDDEESEY